MKQFSSSGKTLYGICLEGLQKITRKNCIELLQCTIFWEVFSKCSSLTPLTIWDPILPKYFIFSCTADTCFRYHSLALSTACSPCIKTSFSCSICFILFSWNTHHSINKYPFLSVTDCRSYCSRQHVLYNFVPASEHTLLDEMLLQ
jgi:hypothetical protein